MIQWDCETPKGDFETGDDKLQTDDAALLPVVLPAVLPVVLPVLPVLPIFPVVLPVVLLVVLPVVQIDNTAQSESCSQSTAWLANPAWL